MACPFPIPERLSSLMSASQRSNLKEHQKRSVSSASAVSDISMRSTDTTASDFLAAKIEQLESETSYIAAIKAGLDEVSSKGVLTDMDYRKELAPYLIRIRSAKSTIRVLKRQRKALEADLTETMKAEKRPRTQPPSDDGLLERAYRDTIVSRVMRAEGKQRGKPFDHSTFKKEVNDYYSTVSNNGQKTWCHVLGMFVERRRVKAAHLVPKSLDQEELAHLFGDEDEVILLPQNALSLHHKIESLLDRGDIAIVPMPGVMEFPTEWRCIVLNESLNTDIVYIDEDSSGQTTSIIRVRDLDNRPLGFRSENRPRRRYLYLRFLISYLWCKRNSVTCLDRKVQSKRFWPSGGSYLEKSTLQTLARCISGCEIPADLTAQNTFDRSSDPERNITTGMALAVDFMDLHQRQDKGSTGPELVDALTESMKRI
ncbi:unnamed protein product [Penicillium salamii]|nr:unnamed protein product [Penicillium salamii]